MFHTYTFRRAILMILSVLVLLGPQPMMAQQAKRCFAETGFCIEGPIRAYWERNGGLAVFGYPISEQRNQNVEGSWSGPVQWFERDRLEDHSNERKGVLAGRLGARYLELQGHPWSRGPATAQGTDCRSFNTETGYSVCGTFRTYWERNGGLERFGYPITGQIQETINGSAYSVQYFERRRMELHPENRGTAYEILLGLLGREVYAAEGTNGIVPTGDLLGSIQQSILDTSYAAIRPSHTGTKLAIGIIDVVGDHAAVLALPFGQRAIHVYLEGHSTTWRVIEATENPSAANLRQRGIPERLYTDGDAATIIGGVLVQLQDPRGGGGNNYVTRPRIVGDFARFFVIPGATEQRDGGSMFFKRNGNTWEFLTAGTLFLDDDLRAMGVPPELWDYGQSVSGPSA